MATQKNVSFVTIDTFSAKRLRVGKIYRATEPVQYQLLPINYKYPSGGVSSLVIRTPELYTPGICVNTTADAQKNINGYSLPIICDNKTSNGEDIASFVDMMQHITEYIREQVTVHLTQIREKRRKAINVGALNILRYNDEDPGKPPMFYAKLLTNQDRPSIIKSQFYRIADNHDPEEIINEKNLVRIDPASYIKQKYNGTHGIQIKAVFISSSLETIQIRLNQSIIVDPINDETSILTDDITYERKFNKYPVSKPDQQPKEETPPQYVSEEDEGETDEELDNDESLAKYIQK